MTQEEMMLVVLQTYDELSGKPILTPDEDELLELCGGYIDTLGLALAAEYLRVLTEQTGIEPDQSH